MLRPFGVRSVRDAVRWPFAREGLLSALACALILWLLSKGGVMGGLAAEGLVVSILFRVTVTTARGADGFHGADDFRGFFEDVLGPLFRAILASVWAWAPFVAWVMLHGGFFRNGDLLQLAEVTSPVPVLLLLAGTFLFPMALLAGALEAPLLHILNPLVVVGYAVRLGRDYALVAGFAVGVSLADSLLLRVLDFIDDHVLGLPLLLQLTALLLPPLMLFRLLGLLVRARGDELGYGGPASYLEPVLGDIAPGTELLERDRDEVLREQLGKAAPQEATPHADAPRSAELAAAELTAAEPAAAERPPAEVRSREPLFDGPAALSTADAGLQIARLAAQGQPGRAVGLLAEAGDLPASLLSAKSWMELARACADAGRPQLAVDALRRAVAIAPQGPLAPQALLLAARLSDEKLRDRTGSDALLRELVERHPASPEGQFAARRLAAGPARGIA